MDPDPDPGGPKTYGSEGYGSGFGSATLSTAKIRLGFLKSVFIRSWLVSRLWSWKSYQRPLMIYTSTSWQIFLASNEGWTRGEIDQRQRRELFLASNKGWTRGKTDQWQRRQLFLVFSEGYWRKSTNDKEAKRGIIFCFQWRMDT